MRGMLPVLSAVALSLVVAACSKQPVEQAMKTVPQMSNNCEWMQMRFDEIVSEEKFCTGLTSKALLASKPRIGGAVLDSVQRKSVSLAGVSEDYFQYDLTFRTRQSTFMVTTLSRQNIELATDKFYAVDLLNTCRHLVLSEQVHSSQRLLESFQMPNRLSCL